MVNFVEWPDENCDQFNLNVILFTFASAVPVGNMKKFQIPVVLTDALFDYVLQIYSSHFHD